MAQSVLLQERRATWEGMSNFCLQSIESEIGQGHDFNFRCNGKIFVVAIRPAGPPDDKIRSLLSKYNSACSRDDDEEEQEVQEEIEDMIYECAWEAFAPLAPAITSPESPSDLHTHLNPDSFYYRLDMVGGKAGLVQEHPPPPMPPFYLTISDALNIQRHSAKDILVLEKFPAIGYIAKVLINGQEACCKIGTATHGTAVQREYESLHTISLSKCADSIRVPKLIGLVVNDDGIIGILEEFVPSEHTLGKILGGSAAPDGDRRKKWAQQIEQTLCQLHEIGVVWGDGKPDNILINSVTDDAWLIDFGGSFTNGWVDVELKETLAGDEQALKKIIRALDT